MTDLDRTIFMNENSITSTSRDDPRYTHYLGNLWNTLQRLFERTGSMEDLNQAIMTIEQVVISDL